MPSPVLSTDVYLHDVATADEANAMDYIRALIMVLNYGYGVRRPEASMDVKPTAAQRTCFCTLGGRIGRFVAQLRSDIPSDVSPEAAGARSQARGSQTPLQLTADLVEWPAAAGTCDPLSIVPEEVGAFVSSASCMFPCPPDGLSNFTGFYAGERVQYVNHTINLLRCGKVGLRDSVLGGGTVFPVLKSDGLHQREVWHGTRVSQACAKPPCPRLLASPSAFVALELGPSQVLRVSKRDGRCFFDQLRLPKELEPFMGRPPLTVGELVGA